MQTLTRTHMRIARNLRRDIGAHAKLIGIPNQEPDAYYAARARSDCAVSLAKYLIDHMETDARGFAAACGMPGYFKQLSRYSDVMHSGDLRRDFGLLAIGQGAQS